MDWGLLFKVLALVLIVEGLMPFLSPTQWKNHMKRLSTAADRQVRIMGLILLLVGSCVLFVVHAFIAK